MDEPTEAGFVIGERTYPVPTLDTFTMDEAQILYDVGGVVLEDFGPPHPELSEEAKAEHEAEQLRKVRSPAFKRALLCVAYARGNPELPLEQVRAAVGSANALDVTVRLFTDQEADAGPPVESSPSEPSTGSDIRTLSRRSDSGSPSLNGSDEPDETPVPIGTSGSDTSSRRSAPGAWGR
jgi:hypothetical protein